MKWEPAAAMVGLILLGVWLVYAPSVRHELRQGARTVAFQVGDVKGDVEIVGEGDEATYRVLVRGKEPSGVLSQERFVESNPVLAQGAIGTDSHALFRILNITGWGSLIWVVIGFGGQIAFFARMAVQWIVSEREKQSVVPPAFWYFSLFGGVALFTYFVWRQDIVGVLGQSSGVVIYARNVRLIYKQNRREKQRAARQAARARAEQPDFHEDPAPEPSMEAEAKGEREESGAAR